MYPIVIRMRIVWLALISIFFLTACKKAKKPLTFEAYYKQNSTLEEGDIIACAAGLPSGFAGEPTYPTAVFFYPIQGATDFRYFEAQNVEDENDRAAYIEKELTILPVFNGYLMKFENTGFEKDRMGIVTYKTPGIFHHCTPIRLKPNSKPTETNPDLITVTEDGITPRFEWTDGIIDENVIYFQVISDTDGNLISGTYTYETNFTFYNLDNVVLNITPEGDVPALIPDETYLFTLMAVSEDNWVNLFGQKEFHTN